MRQEEILDRLLRLLTDESSRYHEDNLVALMAIRGKLATGELMVVGRAVNGWDDDWDPRSLTDEKRKQLLAKIRMLSYPGEGAAGPLSWVTDKWGNKTKGEYNTKKSAFWRVVRRVVSELKIADVSANTWTSHLIWSNLYKVAPADGGNPSNRLAEIQEGLCIELLAEEVRAWKPVRTLFLTGLDWAGPFLDGLKAEFDVRQDSHLVQASGRIPIDADRWGRFVVARHPRRKPEDIMVGDIIGHFGKDNLT